MFINFTCIFHINYLFLGEFHKIYGDRLMGQINPEAEALNHIINETHPVIYRLLSEKGKRIFFPRKGTIQQANEAKGKDINATIGMAIEDNKTPMRLSAISDNVSLDPEKVFPYAPSHGIIELRKTWQNLIKEKNPSLKEDISLPVVTNGITHGLSVAGYLFMDPGDRVILPDLFWGNYRLLFEHAYDVSFQHFNTFLSDGFDTESLGIVLSENRGKQILILNFPHNPTGYSPTNETMEKIVAKIHESAENGNEIAVMTDDAYFGLTYKENLFQESIFSKLADLHENVLAIKIDGATKEDYVWGFRVGFITYASKGITEQVCQALENKTAGRIRGNISNAAHISQSLLLKALNSPNYEEEKGKKRDVLKARFDRVHNVLAKNEKKYSPFFSPLPYNSGYFMCVRLVENLDPETVRQTLLKKFSTGVLATGKLLRIAFSSVAEKDISNLFENIYNACKMHHEKDSE